MQVLPDAVVEQSRRGGRVTGPCSRACGFGVRLLKTRVAGRAGCYLPPMGDGDEQRPPGSGQLARTSRRRLGLRPPDRARQGNPPTEKEDRERRERDRSYRLALASLGLSIVVAVVTPVSSLLVAKQNAASTEQQAEKAFTRDQKKAAYTDFFTAAEQLQDAEVAAGAPQAGPAPTPGASGATSDDFSARLKDLQTTASDLDKKFVLVLVSGSASTTAAATKLDDFVSDNLQDAIKVAYAVNARTPGWQDQYKSLIDHVTSGHASFDDFLNAVRQDMGSEPLDLK
jgi:hypothetical protein